MNDFVERFTTGYAFSEAERELIKAAGPMSSIKPQDAPTPEDVARAIALVIARKMIVDDGGFRSVDRDELALDTVETMWPSLLDEAKAAMEVCGIG